MRRIQIVSVARKREMKNLLDEYLTELSWFDPDIKFDDNGLPVYKWFDCYWVDKDRYPFYLVVDGVVAGVAMIRELDSMLYEFAEFYVCPEYRKDGNAMWFATEITNLFDGQFVFSTRFSNPRAIRFWGKFAKKFGYNEYFDDEIWRNWNVGKAEQLSFDNNLS